jgi:CubicO group peptidase (beta-lactamase class C family)
MPVLSANIRVNARLQVRVLYRQFLFRIFDLDSAHAEGDANKLLGQFASLLVFISVSIAFLAVLLADAKSPMNKGQIRLIFTMVTQHFLIGTTMLVVGLFAVLSWDATYPDRRDALVLGPLPVPARTIFLAKVAAVASALGLTILMLHCAMGLVWPMTFAVNAAPAILPALTFDPTPVPVSAVGLGPVMDRDLKRAFTSGGLAIGVWKHGERQVFTYGTAKPDSLFEIGSISKTVTGLILARMEAEGKVRMDEPVRELLPPGTVAKPARTEITLLDLVTHRSGLPPMPDSFYPADETNAYPYYGFGTDQLHVWLKRRGVERPADTTFVYSNLGVGLLGQALAARAGRTYAELLQEQITGPLGMNDTVVKPGVDQQKRFLQGYDGAQKPVHSFDLEALAGAGGIRSTVNDMMTYLEANLHPERHAELARALEASHRIREKADGAEIGLAWMYSPDSGTYLHNGATPGFTSDAMFNPKQDMGVVVLMNRGPSLVLLSTGQIATHVWQRLSGERAISLDTVVVPASIGFLGVLRQYGSYWFTMLAAGIFVYDGVLGAQGLAAQLLPRQLFLRFSGYMQLAAICLIVGVYFLQPGFGGLDDMTTGSMARLIQWLPSYWFLALYEQLNGSMHPVLAPMASRAWIGLACVVFGTGTVFALSYWRTLKKIVEEPDLAPGPPRLGWLPNFGDRRQTAMGQFAVRTLARSRQHRLIVGFYLGVGLAVTSLLLKGNGKSLDNPWREKSMLLWAASVIMMVLATVGTRVAFALPMDLRANWVFRVIGVRGGVRSLVACRRALLLLAVLPVWVLTAVACLWMQAGWANMGHLAVLALLGLMVADLCLLAFRKVPFTCSWLPGKSRIHMAFLGALGVLVGGANAARLERIALRDVSGAAILLGSMAVAWLTIRLIASKLGRGEEELRFEEEAEPAVMTLGLHRDGVLTVGHDA